MNITKTIKTIIKSKTFIVIFAILIPILIELLVSGTIKFEKSTLVRVGFVYAVYAIIGVFFILNKFNLKIKKVADFLIKYRYIIAGAFLIILVLLKINFSSLDMWCQYLNEPESKSVLLGHAQPIRSDEWLTQSPFMLGQTSNSNNYSKYNENIGQGNNNMLLLSAAPVLDIVTVSRPLTWGFLILGEEFGFSFYWVLKVIALIMVSIELVMKITKKNTLLSLAGGIILALAPAMMWWLSTAVVDGYIYGGAVIVLFSYYMNNLDFKLWKKLLIGLGIIITLPAFAFMLYPAFQVPFAFFMAIFMITDLVKNWKNLKKVDYTIMTITALIAVTLIARFILISWEDIKIMMGTVYPGARFETGGTLTINSFIAYFANIFFPYTSQIENTCEASTYIYSFIGLMILIIYYIKNIKKEKNSDDKKLIISLIVLFIAYLFWEFIGFGKIFSKLTLMYFSPPQRTHVVLGIIGIILSIMLIDKFSKKSIFTKRQASVISIIVVLISYVLIKNSSYVNFFTQIKLEIVFVMIYCMTYFLIRGDKKKWCYTMCIIAIIAGITVNPIASGIAPINKTNISKEIQEIKKEDKDAIWIGEHNFNGQYLVANGVNCINGVNTYPNFNWLYKIDPEKKYNEIYNRFAHIDIVLGKETKFNLLAPDSYSAQLTYENLKQLGVKYYFSYAKSSDENIIDFHMKEKFVDEMKNHYIYEID